MLLVLRKNRWSVVVAEMGKTRLNTSSVNGSHTINETIRYIARRLSHTELMIVFRSIISKLEMIAQRLPIYLF